jgi:hypothetical protein
METAHRPECSHARDNTPHSAFAPCDTRGDGIGIYFEALDHAEGRDQTDTLIGNLRDVESDAHAIGRDVEELRDAIDRLFDAAKNRDPLARDGAMSNATWALDRIGAQADAMENDTGDACDRAIARQEG